MLLLLLWFRRLLLEVTILGKFSFAAILCCCCCCSCCVDVTCCCGGMVEGIRSLRQCRKDKIKCRRASARIRMTANRLSATANLLRRIANCCSVQLYGGFAQPTCLATYLNILTIPIFRVWLGTVNIYCNLYLYQTWISNTLCTLLTRSPVSHVA